MMYYKRGNFLNGVSMSAFYSPISLSYNVPGMPAECVDITLINNPQCLNLTREAIVGIFNGTITRWNDPLLAKHNPALNSINRTIILIVRSDESGTTDVFTRFLATVDEAWNATYGIFAAGCDATGAPVYWNKSLQLQCSAKGRSKSNILVEFIKMNTMYRK